MPTSITLLTSKEININDVKQFSLDSNYFISQDNITKLMIEKEYNPENVSRSYLVIDISEKYNDLAIENYLEFDDLNEHKIELIKDSLIVRLKYNDTSLLYSYISDFFEYFKQYDNETLVDDDYGNLFTIEEFKVKYLSHSA